MHFHLFHSILILIVTCLVTSYTKAQIAEIDSLDKLLRIHTSEDTTRIILLNNIALKLNRTNPSKSFQYATQAAELANKINFKKGKAGSLNIIGGYYRNKGSYTQAIESYETSMQLYEEVGNKRGIAGNLNSLGAVYKYQSKFPKALEFHKKSLQLYKEVDDKEGMSSSLNNIGVVYKNQGDYFKAIDYYQKSILLAEEIGDKIGYSRCLNNFGNVYRLLGNFPKSLASFQEALIIKKEIGDKKGISRCLNNIASIFSNQKDYSQALDYYFKALEVKKELGNKRDIANSLRSVGWIYFTQKDYPKASEYYQKSLQLFEEVGNKKGISRCLNQIGNLYREQEDYLNSIKYLQEALRIALDIGDKNRVGLVNYNLSKVYLKTGKLEKVKYHAEKGYAIADEIGYLALLKSTAEVLAEVSNAIGNYQQAYNYYVIFKATSDSLLNEGSTKELTRLQDEYEFKQEKDSIEFANQQQLLRLEKEIEHQKTTQLTTFIGLTLSVILIIVLLLFFQLKTRSNKQLSTKSLALEKANEEVKSVNEELSSTNEKLLKLNEFKEGVSHMIIHDLKNPLNVIINTTNDDPQKSLTIVQQAGKQMLHMVMNILDINKYEQTKLVVHKSDNNLYLITRNAIDEVLFLAEQKSVEIINKIPTGMVVQTDGDILKRVFINLFTNAIKHTPLNGTVSIKINTLKNQKIKVSVIDTGEGIPANKLNEIFNKFGQAKSKKSGKIRSTGIGLTFCKLAIEAHGEKIGVESEEGKGAAFWFTLSGINKKESSVIKEPVRVTKKQLIQLSEEDKLVLKPYISQLKHLMVYENSAIQAILSEFETNESESLENWKNELEDSLSMMNEERYKELLSL